MTTDHHTDPQPHHPVQIAPNLRNTPDNHTAAREALDRLALFDWHPLAPYPGSDEPWLMRCLLCVWEGERFYSHIGRNKPAKRHPARTDKRTCLPPGQRPAHLRKPMSRRDTAPTHAHAALRRALRSWFEDRHQPVPETVTFHVTYDHDDGPAYEPDHATLNHTAHTQTTDQFASTLVADALTEFNALAPPTDRVPLTIRLHTPQTTPAPVPPTS
ncbi:hypothetical protein ABZW18_26130 [Streptomyces sp. NPDC004647]|uniref:hypothetical protein n=1 Tax=Streptomyces sp. NPDC004647 TaxID=3154671 RepID=UPI0033ACB5C3